MDEPLDARLLAAVQEDLRSLDVRRVVLACRHARLEQPARKVVDDSRAVHCLGPRSQFPFIPADCATLPDHLFESERG